MDEGSVNDLYTLDATKLEWSKVQAKGSLPEPRSFHAMVASGSSLYVFGGCGTGGRLNDLHRFDTESLEWEQMPTSPHIKVGTWCQFRTIWIMHSPCSSGYAAKASEQ
jgi:N-acetylneuraminic acid mutarotase